MARAIDSVKNPCRLLWEMKRIFLCIGKWELFHLYQLQVKVAQPLTKGPQP